MATAPDPAPSPYLLLFRNTGPENYSQLSPDQRQELIASWNSWFEGLLAQGKAVEGQPLEPEIRIVTGTGGARITDGPFSEAKEAIAGYVTLSVGSLEEATAIAQRHPGLAHGLMIEIRQMVPHCFLGVTTRTRSAADRSGA
jgi:hypothetical protein